MVLTRPKRQWWEAVNKDFIELGTLIKQFELYNRTEGKSQATVDWYNLSLKQLEYFLQGKRGSTNLFNLGEPEVRQFILYLQERNRWPENPRLLICQGKLSAITIQTYVRALRAFFSWLFSEGYTSENRLGRLRPPKAPTKLVEILTHEEIARILACLDRDSAAGARDCVFR